MLGMAAKSRVATTDDCDAFQRLMLAMLDQAVWASHHIRQILSF
jgi:hypothetical protein